MSLEVVRSKSPNPRVGPMAQRRAWRPVPPSYVDTTLAPTSNTEFVFPVYPMLGVIRFTGPQALRRGMSHYLPAPTRTWTITGVTRNSSGAALPGVTVHFFQQYAPFGYLGSTVSDGSGVYTFTTNGNDGVSADAYLVGTPDVAGRSINGLVAT